MKAHKLLITVSASNAYRNQSPPRTCTQPALPTRTIVLKYIFMLSRELLFFVVCGWKRFMKEYSVFFSYLMDESSLTVQTTVAYLLALFSDRIVASRKTYLVHSKSAGSHWWQSFWEFWVLYLLYVFESKNWRWCRHNTITLSHNYQIYRAVSDGVSLTHCPSSNFWVNPSVSVPPKRHKMGR